MPNGTPIKKNTELLYRMPYINGKNLPKIHKNCSKIYYFKHIESSLINVMKGNSLFLKIIVN